MSNRYDEFYGYTGFFPILEGGAAISHADELRSLLATLPNDETSLFSRTGLVHAARFFVVDDVVYNGQPSREEHLSYAYLGVSVTFDGELERLAARIAQVGLAEFKAIFSHCYGYDGASTADEVLAYLKACQIETTYLYAQVSNVTLDQTLRALAAQRIIADMVVQCQGLDAAGRKALVRQVAALVASVEPAPAGAFSGVDAPGAGR